MWWVDVVMNDEDHPKFLGPFDLEEDAEVAALFVTMDSSDFYVWKEEE